MTEKTPNWTVTKVKTRKTLNNTYTRCSYTKRRRYRPKDFVKKRPCM